MDQHAVRDLAHRDFKLVVVLREVNYTGSSSPVVLGRGSRVPARGFHYLALGDNGPNNDRGSLVVRQRLVPRETTVVRHTVILHDRATGDEHVPVADRMGGPRHDEYRPDCPPDEHVANAIYRDAGFQAYRNRLGLR